MDPAPPLLQDTLPLMSPVDVTQVQVLLALQGQALTAYQEQLTTLQTAINQLLQVLANTMGSCIPIALHTLHDGSAYQCTVFIWQCNIFFAPKCRRYARKCTFLLTLLTRRALDWATAEWGGDAQVPASYSYSQWP